MKRNVFVLAVVAAAVALMLWFGVRQSHSAPSTALAGAVGAVRGKTAPDFELHDLRGQRVRLSDYRGKAVLLNFWATWCPPCKVEIPWFVDLQKQYGPQGLAVIGIAMDDGGQGVQEFAREMGINYTVLLGNDKVGDAYGGVEALPTTFYIGRDGKVVKRVFGLGTHGEIEDAIKAALQEGTPPITAAAAAGPR